jgi:hypothetical protein
MKKKKVITLVLFFALIFAMTALIEAKVVNVDIKEKCDFTSIDTGISSLISELNSNITYTDFISNSGYSAVELIVGKVNTYYFIYDKADGTVKKADSANADFTVKMTCRQMNNIIYAYNSDNPKINGIKFNRMVLNRIPMKVKSDLLNQCFKTPWCMNRILGK